MIIRERISENHIPITVKFYHKNVCLSIRKTKKQKYNKKVFKKDSHFAKNILTNGKKIDIIVGQIDNHRQFCVEKYSSGEEAPLLRV